MTEVGRPLRVMILGGMGMLAHKLCQTLSASFDTWATVRGTGRELAGLGILEGFRVRHGVDARRLERVADALDAVRPAVVINCIGIVKQLPEASDPLLSIEINALFPHRLASLCAQRGIYLVQISTDCVFSGRRGMYTEDDISDAEDLYGRTKFLGELNEPGCLTLRTSIIGRELRGARGLVEWFLSNRGGEVRGYTNAIFSGLTTTALSEIMADLLRRKGSLEGLYQVSTAPISKYDLLSLVRDAYDVPVRIVPHPDVRVDRSLDGSRFCGATGFRPRDWGTMIGEMVQDSGEYEKWRTQLEP